MNYKQAKTYKNRIYNHQNKYGHYNQSENKKKDRAIFYPFCAGIPVVE